MEGKFSLKEFIAGGGRESWYKSWGYGWRQWVTILAILFVIITLWRAFGRKDQIQTQAMNIWPLSFSTVTYAPQQSQKQEIKKRLWWLPILFVEGYGFSESDGRVGIGSRAGGRFEF